MKKLLFGLIATAVTAAAISAYAANSLPTPVMSDATATPVVSKSASYSSSSSCTPNSAIMPGSDFSPRIDDAVRTQAIKDLLTKIANCESLPYSQDGVVNHNSEGGMPQQADGYYHEYTLIVPGRKTGDGAVPVVIGGQTYMTGTMQSTRGPERIIIGQGNEIFYTMDHYGHFVQLTIVP
jgi:ribonuclease T1